jgi:recombination protein RecA
LDNIDNVLSNINEYLGSTQIVRAKDALGIGTRRISTGILSLDIICGGNSPTEWGMPNGRIIEIFGKEGSGKTTIGLKTIASAQKLGFCGAFINLEGSWENSWAEAQNVDLEKMLLCRVPTSEQAETVLYELVATPGVGVIVVDSIAMLTTVGELDTNIMEKNIQPGTQAKAVNRTMRHAIAGFNRWPINEQSSVDQQPVLIFLNQIREKIGVVYGNPEYSPGGRGKDFIASLRIRTATGEIIRTAKDKPAYAMQLKAVTVKNKTFAPHQAIEYELAIRNYKTKSGLKHRAGEIDDAEQLLTMGVHYKVVQRSGNSYSYDSQSFRGKDAFKVFVSENTEVAEEIKTKILSAAYIAGGL